MGLLQQLNEQMEADEEAEALISVVRNGKPFFDQRGECEAFLYRGTAQSSTDLIRFGTFRRDRVPTDTPRSIHNRVDELMTDTFGHPYRTEALFCTGSFRTARAYGVACILIPQDDFKFVWSRRVADGFTFFHPDKVFQYLLSHGSDELCSYIQDYQYASTADTDFITAVDNNPEATKLMRECIAECFNAAGFIDYALPAAITSLNEIMLRCDSAAYVSVQTINRLTRESIVDKLSIPAEEAVHASTTEQVINLIHKYL